MSSSPSSSSSSSSSTALVAHGRKRKAFTIFDTEDETQVNEIEPKLKPFGCSLKIDQSRERVWKNMLSQVRRIWTYGDIEHSMEASVYVKCAPVKGNITIDYPNDVEANIQCDIGSCKTRPSRLSVVNIQPYDENGKVNYRFGLEIGRALWCKPCTRWFEETAEDYVMDNPPFNSDAFIYLIAYHNYLPLVLSQLVVSYLS